MTMSDDLRVGIVGCGRISQYHISSILKTDNAKLVAVCDANEDLARQTAKKYKVDSYYTDFTELLSEEHLDAVDIVTSPQTHLRLCTQAMEAGCHVLVEKPLALSIEDVDSMIETASLNKVKLCPVHNVLFLPVLLKTKALIEKGVIGNLTGVNITHSLPKDNELVLNREHWCHRLPGGIFGEMLPHVIYLATSFIKGLEPVCVYSQKLTRHDWIKSDEIRAILQSENGTATITVSINGHSNTMDLDIFGTKASLHVSISNGVVIKHIADEKDRISRSLTGIYTGFQWLAGTTSASLGVISGQYHNGHYALTQKFFKSILNNTDSPVTLKEAREVTRLYQAITSQI